MSGERSALLSGDTLSSVKSESSGAGRSVNPVTLTREIDGQNFSLELPDEGWATVEGETARLKELYDEIYRDGPLKYELETFTEDGRCRILYHR